MNYLITGCGFLTKHLIKELLKDETIKKIIIYSRNEKEQWLTKNKFKDERLEFIIGDVRDYEALKIALKDVNYCIHTGAIKRIEVAEKQPMEAIKTNVIGSMNVINACIENKVSKLILISTDKATSATTCYGSTKFLMECMAYANNSETEIICTRYGNVFGSTGSVVPIFDNLVKNNKPLTVRNPNMTRFFMPIEECVNVVLEALNLGENRDLWVYPSKSCTIKELADAFSDNQKIIGTENIEKNDEALLTIEELNHSIKRGKYIVVNPKISDYFYINSEIYKRKHDKPLTSDNAERLTQDEIKEMIENWRKNNV